MAIVALLVNAAYFYWDGGNATGPRHALPLIGAAAIGLGAYWPTLQRTGQAVAAALLAVSIAINAMIASAEIFAPPGFDMAVSGAVWPLFVAGNLRTIPSEYWGWSPWSGFMSWALPAVALMFWLIRVRRATS